MKGAQPETSKKRVRAAANRLEAVKLRRLGYTYAEIAERVFHDDGVTPYSERGAHELVQHALADIRRECREETATLRQIAHMRLEAEFERLSNVQTSAADKPGVVIACIESKLKVLKEQRALWGYEANNGSEVPSDPAKRVEALEAALLKAAIEKNDVKAIEIALRAHAPEKYSPAAGEMHGDSGVEIRIVDARNTGRDEAAP